MNDILECLENPTEALPIQMNENGERSFVVVGQRAKISIDSDTGVLIQTNPWRQ